MSEKKQSFLHGTALLALATAIVKVIGALYKIPLNAIIGEQGFSYFNTAYEIYAVLLMISTAGLPIAMSRMISEVSSLGHYNQVRRIYRTCRAIFLAMGIAGSLLMTLFCRQLAAFQEQPDAWIAIGCLGPCVLFICMISTFRGFFQGQSNMLPTSVSQILEAVCKLIVGMAAAIVLLRTTKSIPAAAGGAILGVTVSCMVSVVYLYGRFRRSYRALPRSDDPVSSYGHTAKQLMAIAIPITIGSAGLQILTTLETKIYMGQLMGIGYTQSQADTMKGIYNMTQTIFNMPSAFILPITVSVIPAITAHLTLKNTRGVRNTAESAIRVTGLICMPCAVGLTLLAEPITALLGGYRGENLLLATRLMTVMGVNLIFYSVVLVTNAIMQAHGHVNIPVVNMAIGGILKLIVVYILTGNPNIGILGTPMGSLLCYVSITLLNLFSIRRVIPSRPAIVKNLVRPLLAALVMGGCAYGTWFGMVALLGRCGNRLLLCAVPIAVGAAVYLFAAVRFKVITREDCLLLPKGEKIASFLHL